MLSHTRWSRGSRLWRGTTEGLDASLLKTKKFIVFIITDKAKLVGEEVKGVGVMKDEEVKLEEIEVSHTLGG